ncbi:PAP2 superfamily protein [Pseudoduganella lurida]|uniref:PAP2 superfamily protein n=1 Tax=Pseudoduganella lurida TaxID=1036180 RepID=A0A562QZ75_9BURK|nr:phosphatase PAP2 family protein [Pseudoduganella lurida]TWI61446.1 PAP2 superfamily protein [Pseudoduganella lurida]
MPPLPQLPSRAPPFGWRLRAGHLLLNWLVFGLCYQASAHMAARLPAQHSVALAADHGLPFWPWTIVFYATSGIFFTLVFLAAPHAEALRVVSRRMLFCTVAAALVFALYPARFTWSRPVLDDVFLGAAYRLLDAVDRPFNQLPSLHVAYCVVFWLALHPLLGGWRRAVLGGWLALVALSTLTTWQHHVLDVAGGLLLGLAAALLVRPGTTRQTTVAFYYALMAGVTLHIGWFLLGYWLAVYGAACLALVALAYARRDPHFTRKRNGRHTIASWLLYWPYLAGYRLTWLLVRWRERHRAPFELAGPGLFIGRRLADAEARLLPPDCHVIDLCAELPETPALRRGWYRHLPLLDLQAPRPSQLRAILALMAAQHRQGHQIFLHCAMGYSRSRFIARLYARSLRPCRSRSTS